MIYCKKIDEIVNEKKKLNKKIKWKSIKNSLVSSAKGGVGKSNSCSNFGIIYCKERCKVAYLMRFTCPSIPFLFDFKMTIA
jgi:hypothetical protein